MTNIVTSIDDRRVKKDGTTPVVFTVTHNGRTAYISSGVYIRPDQFDKQCRMVIKRPDRLQLNTLLAKLHAELLCKLHDARIAGTIKGYTAQQIKDFLIGKEDDKDKFAPAFERFAGMHTNKRTRELYASTWVMIQRFARNAKTLRFADITRRWLQDFDTFLARTSPSANARSIHLRNIRAVFNEAIKDEITTHYPFRAFKIKHEPTRKRNISAADIHALAEMKLPPHLCKYRDFFMLSFYLIGMNSADLLTLTPDAYKDGRITYRRMKTGKLYDIEVLPPAATIIEAYRGERLLLSFAENCANYRHFANRCNNNLQTIRKGLTIYWARHSWATIAAELDVPIDTIAAALGHTTPFTTTNIYIQRNPRKVDEANAMVIKAVASEQLTHDRQTLL